MRIFVSNRMAVNVARTEDGFSFAPSVGGLATGLSSVAGGETQTRWIGWSGLAADELTAEERSYLAETLESEYGAIPVDLTREDLDLFYAGFCNDTIWPLFHYFPTYTDYQEQTYLAYRAVNERFFDVVSRVVQGLDDPGVTIWVHDYQLLLLPGLLKRRFPRARIGFFLHIPFPSFEIFRLLPWGPELLEGVLGADLIGFHTYDYARHFLSSVRRQLGFDHSMGLVQAGNRVARVDVFPMGIDWNRYAEAHTTPEVKAEIELVRARFAHGQVVLSVDRLDYSKGIPNRLRAFERLLQRYPEFHESLALVMIVSPSRESVPQYQELRRQVEETVGRINGTFSTLNWTPVHYRYQTATFAELSALYHRADALLVTPLRDGMNLIAKEYIAGRTDGAGVLILSETAGAARELSEALTVNPNDIDGIAEVLAEGLRMSVDERTGPMQRMQRRLSRLTVQRWAGDFLAALDQMPAVQARNRARALTPELEDRLFERWRAASTALLILDYDGTLQRFFRRPGQAKPDAALMELVQNLIRVDGTTVVISSGRDRANLQEWFDHLRVGMGAGHGAWLREPGADWQGATVSIPNWQETIRPIVDLAVDRTPGSHLEEKDFSLAWHYRDCEPELAAVRLAELRETLIGLTDNLELSVLDGNRVLEVKPTHIHKGRVVQHFLTGRSFDFVFAAGDDTTDEFMFQAMPADGWSIKVGVGTTNAHYSVDGVSEFRELLRRMVAAKAR